jgi:signal transduction histidine kinase
MKGTDLDAYAATLGRRLEEESRALAMRWLDRLNDLLLVERDEIFPTEQLLDHIPQLIREIGHYLSDPGAEELVANTSVVVKARELGLLRHAQRASVHQLLREYYLLGGILETFLREATAGIEPPPTPQDALALASRLSQALRVLQQTTIDTFIAEYSDTIGSQQARLESFNRMVSHELRQPLGVVQFTVRALRSVTDEDNRLRLLGALDRNVGRAVELIRQLERITRMRGDDVSVAHQEVHVTVLVKEVARQLREMADQRGVEVRVAEDLPQIVTDSSRLELALVNLISNGIKYSDPAKPVRYVEVFLSGATDDGHSIGVRDNGIGIPAAAVPLVFQPFYRVAERAAGRPEEGSGLGLAIAAECLQSIGGRIAVASVENEGTVFEVWLPRGAGG